MSRKYYLTLIPILAIAGSAMAAEMPMMKAMTTKGSIKVLLPKNGQKIASIDIPVKVSVSNFTISAAHVGMADRDREGHIHVMLDGMNMGVLYNFYTGTEFTLPGRAMTPGKHTLIFDLASNTHEDFANTVQKVEIDYQPRKPIEAPQAAAAAKVPEVSIISPADGDTVGPKFTINVEPEYFQPAENLEGKPNIPGYGHYHVFVDMKMDTAMSEGMMSMAGMVGMPGNNSFPVDLSAWKKGKHVITVMPVQNDHTEIPGAKPAMITVDLE
jgi:hypothetical protein